MPGIRRAAFGLSDGLIGRLLDAMPSRLRAARCFLDRMTGFWRYEFGQPFHFDRRQELVWGSHMWVLVWQLREVITAALTYLSPDQMAAYLAVWTIWKNTSTS